MRHLSPSNDNAPRSLWQSLDRFCGELNVFLCALAIGLAVLDFACFIGVRTVAEVHRANQRALAAAAASAAMPAQPMPLR